MEEFTLSTGKKVLYIFSAILWLALILPLFKLNIETPYQLEFCLIYSTSMIALACFMGGQLRKKVIISVDNVIKINALQKKELPTSEIKGCRIREKRIIIEPNTPSFSKIIIYNYSHFDNSEDLTKWLKENFRDLDAEDFAEETEKVLNDSTLGTTKEERETKIKRSKWIALAFNLTGLIIGIVPIYFERSSGIAIASIFMPLIGALIMLLSKGLIKFIEISRNSIYNFSFGGIFIPSVSLFAISFNYNVVQYQPILLPGIVIFFLMFIILYLTGFNKNTKSVTIQILVMLLVSVLYGYGTVVSLNCLFDKTEPQIIHTTVYKKEITHNKGTYYHLYLNSWDSDPHPKMLEVSYATYNYYSNCSLIDVKQGKGLLNIPWYHL